MSSDFHANCGLAALVRDPLVRLVMASDRVSEAELVALMRRVGRARRRGDAAAAFALPPLPRPAAAEADRRGWSAGWR